MFTNTFFFFCFFPFALKGHHPFVGASAGGDGKIDIRKQIMADYEKIRAEEWDADVEVVETCHSMLELVCCVVFNCVVLYFTLLLFFFFNS
jgi:hypothetical protein